MPECDKVCAIPQKRRMHLIDKHMFPKYYDFFIVNSGIDRRSSMLRDRHRRLSSAASRALARGQQSCGAHKTSVNLKQEPEVQKLERATPSVRPVESSISSQSENSALPTPTPPDTDMDSLSSTLNALKFVPPSVRFGRGRRAGFTRT